MQRVRKKAKWISRRQERILRILKERSPMSRIELAWIMSKIDRATKVEYDKNLPLENLSEFMKKIMIEKPKLSKVFSASLSRSLKRLEKKKLIEVYKDNFGVKVRITKDGEKVLEFL